MWTHAKRAVKNNFVEYLATFMLQCMWKKEADPFLCFIKAAAYVCKDVFLRDVLSNHVKVKEDEI